MSSVNETETEKSHLLGLLCAGIKNEKFLKLINKFSSKVVQTNVKTCIAYSGTKLSSQFQIKVQTKKDHQHELLYYAKCPELQCTRENQEGV